MVSIPIKFRRGNKANLPTLADGEPAITEDTKEFFVGTTGGNAQIGGPHHAKHEPNGADALDLTKITPFGATLPTLPNAAYPIGILFWLTTTNVIYQNQSGTWVAVSGGGGSSTLASDTDVAITSPQSGDELFYNPLTSKWQNGPPSNKVVTGAQTSKVQLDYSAATDILSNTSLPATTWTDVVGNQSFTVDDGQSVVEVSVRGSMLAGNEASGTEITTRIVIDAAGSPITKQIGGQYTNTSGYYVCPINGGDIILTGLPAGSHTIKVQTYANNSGGSMYLRASTQPNIEFLAIQVIERKASGSSAQSVNKVQLDWTATTDIWNAASLVGTTWTDIPTTSLSFTVDDGQSMVEVDVSGLVEVIYSAAVNGSVRVLIDGTTGIIVGRGVVPGNTTYTNLLQGSSPITLVGLAPGSHTIKLQYYMNNSGATGYISAASYPNLHGLSLKVIERKLIPFNAMTQLSKVQLDYALASDISALSLPGTTWTDFISSQAFTVDDAASVIDITVSGSVTAQGPSGTVASRLLLDGASVYKLGGGIIPATNEYANPLSGVDVVSISGLSVGIHTLKVQLYPAQGTSTVYARPATSPNAEFVLLKVIERKVAVLGPSGTLDMVKAFNSTTQSIPNATYTALTYDSHDTGYTTNGALHSISSNTSRFVAQVAGRYKVGAYVSFQNGGNTYRALRLQVNGSTIVYDGQQNAGRSASASEELNTEVYLGVGDYVEVLVYQDTGGALSTYSGLGGGHVVFRRIDGGAINPMTAQNDVIVGGSGGVPTRLAGVANKVLGWDASGAVGAQLITAASLDAVPGLDGTFGDDFTGTSLASKWTRQGFTSGGETYADGGNGSWLSQASNLSSSNYYYQTAPSGSFAFVLAYRVFGGQTSFVGLEFVDATGKGIGMSHCSNPEQWIVGALVGAVYAGSGQFAGGVAPCSLIVASGVKAWQYMAYNASTGVVTAKASLDGNVWSPPWTYTPPAFTPTRVGFGIWIGSFSHLTIDRFNRVA